MKTTTLDEALRERGRKKLEEEMSAIFAPVFRLYQIGYGLAIKDDKGVRVYAGTPGESIAMNQRCVEAHQAVKMAKDAIVAYRLEAAEQAEVDAFIASVAELRGNVEQIYAGLPRD